MPLHFAMSESLQLPDGSDAVPRMMHLSKQEWERGFTEERLGKDEYDRRGRAIQDFFDTTNVERVTDERLRLEVHLREGERLVLASAGDSDLVGFIRYEHYEPAGAKLTDRAKSNVGRALGKYPYLYAPDVTIEDSRDDAAEIFEGMMHVARTEFLIRADRPAFRWNPVVAVDALVDDEFLADILETVGFREEAHVFYTNLPEIAAQYEVVHWIKPITS